MSTEHSKKSLAKVTPEYLDIFMFSVNSILAFIISYNISSALLYRNINVFITVNSLAYIFYTIIVLSSTVPVIGYILVISDLFKSRKKIVRIKYVFLYSLTIFVLSSILNEIYIGIEYAFAKVASLIVFSLSTLEFLRRTGEEVKFTYFIYYKYILKHFNKLLRGVVFGIVVMWVTFGILLIWLNWFLYTIVITGARPLSFVSVIMYATSILTMVMGLIYITRIIGIKLFVIRSILSILSVSASCLLGKFLYFDGSLYMYLKSIELISFLYIIIFFILMLYRIKYSIIVISEVRIKAGAREPKIILLEYLLEDYGKDKNKLAEVMIDKITDPTILGSDITTFDTIVIYSIKASPVIEYIEDNIYMYLLAGVSSMDEKTPRIYSIILGKTLSLPRLYSLRKGLNRYEVGIDPTYTPYLVEKIRQETRSRKLLVIVENPVDLINLVGFKRFYEILHTIIERLRPEDTLVIFVPVDVLSLMSEKYLYALRNLALKIVELF